MNPQIASTDPLSQIGLVIWLMGSAMWAYCLIAGRIPSVISGFAAMAWLDIDRTKEPTAYWVVMVGSAASLLYWLSEIVQ